MYLNGMFSFRKENKPSAGENFKAYVPLRRKTFTLGPYDGLDPQRQNFTLGIPTCWYLKTLEFALSPATNRSASQLNIGCDGSQTVFQWNMGLKMRGPITNRTSDTMNQTIHQQTQKAFQMRNPTLLTNPSNLGIR